MIRDILMNVVAPFIGTGAYVVLFNVPRQYYFCCGITGMVAWLAYRWMLMFVSPAPATFLATVAAVLLSRILTVYKKCPITIFLLAGIIPLVPGVGIYRTAYYLVLGRLGLAGVHGLEAVKIAFAIVLGIAFVVAIPREVFQARFGPAGKWLKDRGKL